MVEAAKQMGMGDPADGDRHIELWKIKRMIKMLQTCKGNGTSFVSLCIPPKDQLTRINTMLTDELSGAANIRSKATKNSVMSAITSTKEKLKLYKKTPENGLIIYCGQIMMDDGKSEKKITYDLEPFKPA
jgi:peptide chain release factor subunit 1